MKFIVFLLLFFLAQFSANAQQQEVNWQKDYREASRIAVETGKPMLLDFTAAWCKPCREMEAVFWSRADVVELSKEFVCVKVDLEKNAKLANEYRVEYLPNVVMTDSWGSGVEFHRGFGINGIRDISEKMRRLPKDFSPIREARRTIESDKKNLDALRQIAEFYRQKKFYYLSSEFYERLLKLEKNVLKRELLTLNLAENYLQIGWNADAKKMLETFKKEFPNSAQMEKVNRDLANL